MSLSDEERRRSFAYDTQSKGISINHRRIA